MDYTFPPKPTPKHLELQRVPTEAPEPSPSIPHAGGYMDIAEIRKVQSRSQERSTSSSAERKDSRSPSKKPHAKGDSHTQDTGVIRLPWDKQHGRSPSGIASGLAMTIKFGAAAIPAEAVAAQFRPSTGNPKT